MIITGLLVYVLVVSYLGPRALSRTWTDRFPAAGLLAWHVVVSTVMISVVGAAFLAAHDIWEPIATIVFRADPASVHHQYVGTATVGHAWNAALLVVGILILRVLLVAVNRRRRSAADRNDLRSAVRVLSPRRLTPSSEDVVVVGLREPTAFCVPGRDPMIVVSEGALKVLSTEQVAAVVAHERAHLSHRHAAGTAWAAVVADSFRPWTLARDYASAVPRLHEMQADDVAAKATGGHVVAASLLALSGRSTLGSLSMAAGDVRDRSVRLLVPPRRQRGIVGLAVAGIAALAMLPTLLVVGPGLTVAGSDHHPELSHGESIPHP